MTSSAAPPEMEEKVGDKRKRGLSEAEDALRGRPLPPATLAYFKAIQAKVEAFDASPEGEDEEELTLLTHAAWREMKGAEYRLLVNRQGSRAVETLLRRVDSPELTSLLSALIPTAFPLFTDRVASHTLDKLLHRLPPLLTQQAADGHWPAEGEAEGEPDSSSTATVAALCHALSAAPPSSALAGSTLSAAPSSHWPLLLCNESASHLLRSLFLLLTGHDHLTDLLHPPPSSARLPLVVPVSSSPAPSSVSPQLDFALADVVASVEELKEADRVELMFHTSASPALQCLVAALASHSTYSAQLKALIGALLLSDPTGTPFDLSAAGVMHEQQLSRDRIGSHLTETLLAVTAACSGLMDVFEQMALGLLPDLHELSVHSLGNHVVQRLLTAASSPRYKSLLQRCLKRLRPHLRAYIDGGRLGVVWRALQACAHVSNRSRDRFVAAFMETLECEDAQLLQRLLTLQPTAATQSAREEKEESTAAPPSKGVSYFGSVILQALLSLPSSTPLLSSLLALPSAAFVQLACDARGVHVLERVLAVGEEGGFTHSLSHQHALVDVVISHLTVLSQSVHGSFLVEKAYRAADVQRKRRVTSELAPQERVLRRSKSGLALLRTVGLQRGNAGKDRSELEAGKRRKAAMFADILQDEPKVE